MTINYKIYNFPTFAIDKQVFYVPGIALAGGFTAGGARISSPSPGAFGYLDIQPALQTHEWDYPLTSWVMSKVNGEILRVRLAPTPQICGGLIMRENPALWDGDLFWSNDAPWTGDLAATFSSASLEGTNVVEIDMSTLGQVLQCGHVIGHGYSTYLVDEISYDAGNIATVTIKPPLRKNVAVDDMVNFRPYFTGVIANPTEIIQTYDSENNGHIQMPKIVLQEVII